MIPLGIVLLLFHQGHALMPVTEARLGDPATFQCLFPDWESSNTRVKWYKQSIGDTLTLIVDLLKNTPSLTFQEGFSSSKFDANHTSNTSTLSILKTGAGDEAVYHCQVLIWSKDRWSGTYLSLKGNAEGQPSYTIVQLPPPSAPVRPGASVTLQCSVLSDSEKKTCPRDHSVYWFGVTSDTPQTNIIYHADGSGRDGCDDKPGGPSSPKSCVYNLSKNVSSSDAGTYYCAVATCGEILFGNGTKLDIEGTGFGALVELKMDNIILFLLCAILAIAVVVIAFLTNAIRKNKCDNCNNKAVVLLQEYVARRNAKSDEDLLLYSTAVFATMDKSCGGKRHSKAADRERIYAAVKAFGLD